MGLIALMASSTVMAQDTFSLKKLSSSQTPRTYQSYALTFQGSGYLGPTVRTISTQSGPVTHAYNYNTYSAKLILTITDPEGYSSTQTKNGLVVRKSYYSNTFNLGPQTFSYVPRYAGTYNYRARLELSDGRVFMKSGTFTVAGTTGCQSNLYTGWYKGCYYYHSSCTQYAICNGVKWVKQSTGWKRL